MKLMKLLLPLAMAVCSLTLNAGDFSTVQEARERDPDAVLDYLKSKRAVTLAEKGGNLSISGDVKAEWDYMHARSDGKIMRGHKSSKRKSCKKPDHTPFATSEYAVETNLMFDYKTDRTWTAIQFQFDNPMGIRKASCLNDKDGIKKRRKNQLFGSGEQDNIVMRKAYFGYNFLDQGTSRLDLEVGHRRLYDVFDSEVQFYNFFDGATLKYAHSFEGVTDLTAKAAAFVIDMNNNHYGYVGEVGFLNIADTGIDLKYSAIDWQHHGANRYGKKHAWGSEFLVSQYTAAYTLPADWCRWKTKIYGAFLHNSKARKHKHFHNEKAANAWYAGVRMGEVRKKGDWAVEANYQWVEAQSIPETDVSGIKRDNPTGTSLYDHNWGGFANYKGYKLDAFYAFTDNLTLNTSFEKVREVSHRIGHKHRSYQFQVSAIYAF
ncbi:MAG: putative porin [Chlamydiales bacterium]|nr:putative porin [Chlamydiales bacterium]